MMHDEEVIDDLLDKIKALKAERDALKADAERYRWLRQHRYKPKYSNPEIDSPMHLSFLVSGAWKGHPDPSILDEVIDSVREVK